MSVTTTHPDYDAHLHEWEIMDEALVGESAIKANNRNLPKPAGMAEAEKLDASSGLYESYCERAQYPEWVKDGLRVMMGLVAKTQPQIELPSALAGMEERATSDGFGLEQLFVRVVRQVVSHGRAPLVVNVDDNGQPYITMYRPINAINWKESVCDSGRTDLTLAVFREFRDKENADIYSHETEQVYRVYQLKDGVCVSKVEKEDGELVSDEVVLGRYFNNELTSGLDFLPIVYCGSTDNAPDVDEVPLLTMAKAALKYYQLSADYYQSLHYTSHPQPWVSGLDSDAELTLTGPSAAWNLGHDGSCGYLEFQGHGIEAVRKAMQEQKGASLEAGARVMDVSAGAESGEARKARQNDQHATLHTIVVTVAEAIEQCLRYAAKWLGADESAVSFTVEPDFSAAVVDPQMVMMLRDAALAGLISNESFWLYLTTGKLPAHDYNSEWPKIESSGDFLGVDNGELS